ncbi:MAG: GDSL-type esterase/lipase family protein [Gammaproteobacteria bacterium]
MTYIRSSFFIRAVLLISLVAAAVSAQAQNTDPTRWEEAMQRFDEQDRMSPPPEGAIVLTGSSSIARWNDQAAAALAPLTVIPRGFGGSIMSDVLHHLDRVALRYKPRAILIYEGDNDTAWEIPNDEIVGNFEKIVARIHEQLPATRIYVMSVKPSVLRANVWSAAEGVNQRLHAIADKDPLVYYVDAANPFLQADGSVMTDIFVDDDLHLNDLGNLIWGSVIRAALMPQEARFERHSH